MLVQESHVDVPTTADGQGSMRMYSTVHAPHFELSPAPVI